MRYTFDAIFGNDFYEPIMSSMLAKADATKELYPKVSEKMEKLNGDTYPKDRVEQRKVLKQVVEEYESLETPLGALNENFKSAIVSKLVAHWDLTKAALGDF